MEKLTHDALKLNFNRPNYQAKLGIGLCQHDIAVNSGLPEISPGCHVTYQGLELVSSLLCLLCFNVFWASGLWVCHKCKSATKCIRSRQVCIPAC